jgi:hypothetical protein
VNLDQVQGKGKHEGKTTNVQTWLQLQMDVSWRDAVLSVRAAYAWLLCRMATLKEPDEREVTISLKEIVDGDYTLLINEEGFG